MFWKKKAATSSPAVWRLTKAASHLVDTAPFGVGNAIEMMASAKKYIPLGEHERLNDAVSQLIKASGDFTSADGWRSLQIVAGQCHAICLDIIEKMENEYTDADFLVSVPEGIRPVMVEFVGRGAGGPGVI